MLKDTFQCCVGCSCAPAASGAAKMPLTVVDTTTTVKGSAILKAEICANGFECRELSYVDDWRGGDTRETIINSCNSCKQKGR